MRLRQDHTVRLVAAVAGWGLLAVITCAWGCAQGPTTVLVTVAVSGATPTTMNVSVYDRFGVIADAVPIAHPGPGTLIVKDLPAGAQTLRVVLRGPELLGGARVDTVPHQQVSTSVTLAGDTPDRDGDGVPDALDDCPDTPDPKQTSTAGDGVGDACRNTADLSASDGLADLGGGDLIGADLMPMVLFEDEFDGGTLNSAWGVSYLNTISPSQSGGALNLVVTNLDAYVDVHTKQTFAVGSTTSGSPSPKASSNALPLRRPSSARWAWPGSRRSRPGARAPRRRAWRARSTR